MRTGLSTLQRQTATNPFELRALPDVSSLADNPTQNSEFLIGEQPIWADIQTGRAIIRDSDEELWTGVAEKIASDYAPDLVREAVETLTSLIERIGERDYYPYHVRGSQGLSWARRGIDSSLEKERFLRGLISQLEGGCRAHPRAAELKNLLNDVKLEHFGIAAPSQTPLLRP
jgi:hypothetical protein